MFVCRYALTLEVIKELPKNSMIEITFENPANINQPLIVDLSIQNQKTIIIKSPDLVQLEPYRNYEVVVDIYSSESKSQLIGQHIQFIRSEIDLDYINRRNGNKKITESIKFDLDDKKWQLGYLVETNNQKIIEYVPVGQTVESWTELLTSLHISQEVDLTEYLDIMQNQITEKYSSPKFTIIEESSNNALYEWSHSINDKVASEFYIVRLIKGENNLYSLTYATKLKNVYDENRNKWIEILKGACLK